MLHLLHLVSKIFLPEHVSPRKPSETPLDDGIDEDTGTYH